MWKDVVVAWFILLPWHLLKKTKAKYDEHPVSLLRLRSRFEANTHKMQVTVTHLAVCFRSVIEVPVVYLNTQFISFIFCILIWVTIFSETSEKTSNRGEKQYSGVCESMRITTTNLYVCRCHFKMSITTCHTLFAVQIQVLNQDHSKLKIFVSRNIS